MSEDLEITALHSGGVFVVRIPEVLAHFLIWGGPKKGIEYAENALRDALVTAEDTLSDEAYEAMLHRLTLFLEGDEG